MKEVKEQIEKLLKENNLSLQICIDKDNPEKSELVIQNGDDYLPMNSVLFTY